VIDALVSHFHYWRHLAPVWEALPERGTLWAPPRLGIPGAARGLPQRDRLTLTAGWRDSSRVGRAVLIEHGAGQSYGADPACAADPSYAGGGQRDNVELFLMPGPHPAGRQRAATPDAPVAEVGCPALDPWLARDAAPEPDLVALAFNWDCGLCSESRSALPHYRDALPELARRFRVVGHCHPRARTPRAEYRAAGIPWATYEEVLARAAVVVADNSSIGFEAAALGRGRRVLWLDCPWYRREHGLRFFDACPERVADLADLPAAVEEALAGRLGGGTLVRSVYRHLDGSATRRAVEAVSVAAGKLAA
jgi:hypothetical protein